MATRYRKKNLKRTAKNKKRKSYRKRGGSQINGTPVGGSSNDYAESIGARMLDSTPYKVSNGF
jgi:hypothetical protein